MLTIKKVENDVSIITELMTRAIMLKTHIISSESTSPGLVNGAAGFMHSLSFPDDPPPELADALASTGFSIVQLKEPPLSVNFQVTLPDGEDGEGI